MAHKNMPCVYWQEGDKCSKFTDDECDSFCVLGPCSAMRSSNADRIRAMSDEELAEFGASLPCCPPGPNLVEYCFPTNACENSDFQKQCWLDWLKSPAEVE